MQIRSERMLRLSPTAPLLVPTPSTPVGVKEVSTEEILDACLRCVKRSSTIPPMRRSVTRT